MPRCTALTVDGNPCRATAVRATDPPRCPAHRAASEGAGGVCARPDADPGDRPFGPADLDALIEDLERRVAGLSGYIDDHAELSPSQLLALLRLQGELTSRIGRLLRDRARLARDLAAAGREQEELDRAINEALDAASAMLGAAL